MSPKDIHKLDQSIAFMSQEFPRYIYLMFANFKKEGFTEEQAFALVNTYVYAVTSNRSVDTPPSK